MIPHLGDIRLQELNRRPVEQLFTTSSSPKDASRLDLIQAGHSSRTTVRYIATIIRKATPSTLESGLVVRNVATAAHKPRGNLGNESQTTTWAAQEVAHFLESTADNRLHPLWVVYATTGLRHGEALGLRWEDVDLPQAQASIRQNLVVVRGGVSFGTPKSGRGRLISLAPQTVDALRTWRAHQMAEKLAFGAARVESQGLVFTREDGSPLHPDRVTDAFRRSQTNLEHPPTHTPPATPHLGHPRTRSRRSTEDRF